MERSIAVSLGQLVCLVFHDRCTVYIFRYVPAECLIQQIILRSRGKVLVAAYNMGDAHEVVVHNVGKVVGRHAVGLNQDLVVQCAVLHCHISVNVVVECGSSLQRHLLANDVGNTCVQLFLNFFRREIPAVAVIHGSNVRSFLNFPHFFQTLLVTEAVICVTGFHQFFRVGLEHAHTLRLYIRSHRTADVRTFVPVQTGNPQGVIDHINGTFYITFLIGVLDPQNKIAVLFLGDQIGKQCGTQVADVHIARRAGCKSGSHSFVHC